MRRRTGSRGDRPSARKIAGGQNRRKRAARGAAGRGRSAFGGEDGRALDECARFVARDRPGGNGLQGDSDQRPSGPSDGSERGPGDDATAGTETHFVKDRPRFLRCKRLVLAEGSWVM